VATVGSSFAVAIAQGALTGIALGLLVFISLMGGMAAFGFIGLVIGPVAIAALTTLLGGVIEDEPP
jgi:predicted PurR-regulated permease PerM